MARSCGAALQRHAAVAVLRAAAAAGDLSKRKALHARAITAAHFGGGVLYNNLISFYAKPTHRRIVSTLAAPTLHLLLPPPLALGTKATEAALRLGPSATEGQSQAWRRRQRLPLPPLAPSPQSSAHRQATLRTHLPPPSRLRCTVGVRPAAQSGRALAPPNPAPQSMARPCGAVLQRHAAVAVLRAAAAAGDLSKGKALHARIIKAAHFDVVLHNNLISFYAKCGRLGLARKVFDAMPLRNAVSGNLLMSGYASLGRHKDSLALLRVVDFGLNEYVLSAAVSATANIRSYDMGRQCHGYAVKAGLAEQRYVFNAVLYMYCQCAHMEDAAKVFENVSGFDAFAYNSMINGFLDRGLLDGSFGIVRSMTGEVEKWDYVSYVAVLGHCASMKDFVLGIQVHAQALKKRLELNVYVGSALVDMYGKCDHAHDANHAFEVLPEKNVVSWTAVMTAYNQNELYEDALQLFLDMEMEGVQPNEFTYAVALNSCAGLAALRTGNAFGACAMKSGHWDHLLVGNGLMNMYSKSGSIEDAHRVFISMPLRDVVSWNLMITGYAHHGLAREAMEAFHSMLSAAVVLSYVTFVGVLSACAQLGLVDEGFYYLNTMMKEVGIKPGKEHYTCMVGLLCRAGRLDEAERFIVNNCIGTDVVAWRSLLNSCQVYKNYGLGHRVAEQILQLEPNDIGTYVLLSNMYAKANRWDGVVKVRKHMRERGVRKAPGVSWIQVGSDVHVFTSEDKVHPQMDQITEKLEELVDQIKAIGYVPNFAVVLHDIEDEQKEEHLMYHSEKLALAFGLLHTPIGATIHIMKNLRICDDCHVAFKLISVVTSRKIVVRDAVRFHCIEGGICSCNDYW